MEEVQTINPNMHFAALPIHTVALLLAMCSNVSAITIIAKTQRLHTPSCYLMMFLAIADLTLSMVWNATPLAVLDERVRAAMPTSWLCKSIGVIWQVAISVLAFLHGFVALDRYFFIVHPMKYQVHVTVKRSLFVVGAIFLTAVAMLGLLLLKGNEYVYSPAAMTCVGPSYWSIIFLVVIFLPSLIVSVFSYHRIWTLYASTVKQNTVCNSGATSSPSSRRSTVYAKKKMIEVHQLSKSNSAFSSRSSSSGNILLDASEVDAANEKEDMCLSEAITARESKMTTQLTTSTTIAGTCRVSLLEESGGQSSINGSSIKGLSLSTAAARGPNHPTSPPRNSKIIEESRKKDNFESKQYSDHDVGTTRHTQQKNAPSYGPRLTPVPMVASITSSPNRTLREHFSPHGCQSQNLQEVQGSDNTISDHPTSTSQAGPNNTDVFVGPKLLQLVAIVNPVISWMLIHQWANQEGNMVVSDGLYTSNRSVNLPQECPRPHQTRQRQNILQRHLRACLLVVLPVLGMMASFLPFIFCLLYWDYGPPSQSDFSVIFCHLCYAMAPSSVSLFLSLSNKPYRRALARQMHVCCCHPCHS